MTAMIRRAESIADEGPSILEQEDTFFFCPKGRLKLRKFSDSAGELIYYDRPDTTDPEESRYFLSPTFCPDSLGEALSRALGVRGSVRKKRILYLTGQTRIHLDDVEGLGWFLELEVVLNTDQGARDGVRIAETLMDRLAIKECDLVETAYIDLLESASA